MQDVQGAPLPCLRCGRELDAVDSAHMPTQPYAATTFVAYGQYGSTVFDPSPHSREFLEINVCDPCLRECAAGGVVAVGRKVPADAQYEVWSPDGDDVS